MVYNIGKHSHRHRIAAALTAVSLRARVIDEPLPLVRVGRPHVVGIAGVRPGRSGRGSASARKK